MHEILYMEFFKSNLYHFFMCWEKGQAGLPGPPGLDGNSGLPGQKGDRVSTNRLEEVQFK